MNTWREWRPFAALGGLLLAAYAYLHLPWRGAPLEILSIEATAQLADQGNGVVLSVESRLIKHRTCPATITRAIFYEDGETSIALGSPVGPQLAPTNGEPIRRIARFMLPVLPPGRYAFQSVTVYDCDDDTYTVASPLAWFTLPPAG